MFEPVVTEEIYQHTLSLLYNIYLLKLWLSHNQDWHMAQQYQELRQHLQAIIIINAIHEIFNTSQINNIFDYITKL